MTTAVNINHQDHLLSVNHGDEGWIMNTLPGVHVKPCFLDPEKGIWVIYARFEPGTRLPRHFHTGSVHFITTRGSWNYAEYPDDVQKPGSYLYEPGGSIHAFVSEEGAEGFMYVEGANVNLNDDDSLMFIMDAGWIEKAVLAAAEKAGMAKPRYITPGTGARFSDV